MEELAAYFEGSSNPKSDAEIEYAPTEGHCAVFSDMTVLKQIQAKLKE